MHRAGRRASKVNGCEKIGSSPTTCSENAKRRMVPEAPFAPKAASGSRVPQIAPPHGQAYFGTRRAMHKGQDGATGFRAASDRLKRKSAVRQNGAIKTGADNGAHGRASRALPLRLKPSGEFLKTAHWAVFLTEFHLIGSSPDSYSKTKTAEALASAVRFLERTTGLEPATPTLARWCSTN